MGFWILGRLPTEQLNLLNGALIRLYQPGLDSVLRDPKTPLVGSPVGIPDHVLAGFAAGRGVSPAAGRGRPPLHAFGVARPLRVDGLGSVAKDRPTDQALFGWRKLQREYFN